MEIAHPYVQYPARIVIITGIFTLLIYLTGSLILYPAGWGWVLAYIAYGIFLEIRLISRHCPHCFYYNRVCAFGKGKLSGIFFKKGKTEMFTCKSFSWMDMIPDMLIFLIPFIAGMVMLILEFSWPILILMILLILLNFPGNGYIRGQLACNHCKQAEIGCPALDLFNSKKS
jgi:hypothetical protein